MSVRKLAEPLQNKHLSFKAGKLVQVYKEWECYAWAIIDPVKCVGAVMSFTKYSVGDGVFACGCVRHSPISLKGGQIGIAISYTENTAGQRLIVALFDEQLILAFANEFEEIVSA